MIINTNSSTPLSSIIQQESEREIILEENVDTLQEISLANNIFNKHFEPFTDTEENDDSRKLLIENWLAEEGFEIENNNTHQYREQYEFIATKQNDCTNKQYLVEVKDYGKQISKLKLVILRTGE